MIFTKEQYTKDQFDWLKKELKKIGVGVRATAYCGESETYTIQFINGFKDAVIVFDTGKVNYYKIKETAEEFNNQFVKN